MFYDDRFTTMQTRTKLGLLFWIAVSAFGADSGELPAGLYAVFTTSEGVITAKLYEKYTPKAVANFAGLAMGTKAWRDPKTGAMVMRPLYDNITFHRIIRDEMIQAGRPHGCRESQLRVHDSR